MKIFIGTAGVFDSNKIDSCEVEFTYGVKLSEDTEKNIKYISENNNLKLSVHAPYYINLNSLDKSKIIASKKRIIDSCIAGKKLLCKNVVFHPGFYMKSDPKTVYNTIKENILEIQDFLKEHKIDIELTPETTGKPSQFGSLDELMKLNDEIGLKFCIDFSHVKARNNGLLNYSQIIEKISNFKESYKQFHSHYSGIHYGEKGEIKHLLINEKETEELLSSIYNSSLKEVNIICESPLPYEDALNMIKIRDTLLNKKK